MRIEVRVELISKKWKELLKLWNEVGASTHLSGILGSVVGLFQQGSPDYAKLLSFLSLHQSELGIRVSESRRAVYSLEEKRTYPLSAIFLQTVSGAVPLRGAYEVRPCSRCGRTPPPTRVGPMVLVGSAYQGFRAFFTDANEVVVHSNVKVAMESSAISGARFQQCVSSQDAAIDEYFQLLPNVRLGPRLTREGSPLACECGQWDVPPTAAFPPEFIYRRDTWNGDDVVFSGDLPAIFLGSPAFIDLLSQHEPTLTWDQCLPIHLI